MCLRRDPPSTTKPNLGISSLPASFSFVSHESYISKNKSTYYQLVFPVCYELGLGEGFSFRVTLSVDTDPGVDDIVAMSVQT